MKPFKPIAVVISLVIFAGCGDSSKQSPSEGSGAGASPSANGTTTVESKDVFCDRAREILSRIAREERRLDRIVGRLKLARVQGNRRGYDRSYAVGKKSYDRTVRLWQHISLSFHSRR